MSTFYNNQLQNYFNQNTLICLPSAEDMLNFDTLLVRLPYNQFIDAENIRVIFEKNFEFGTIEKIDKVLNSWNVNDFQVIYVIKFHQIFRQSECYLHMRYNLLNWGYNDICILFAEDNTLSMSVRVFYDKFIGSDARMSVDSSAIDAHMTQIKTEMRENYEQFESIVETDVNLLEEKNEELKRELAVVKDELSDAMREMREMKDQIKWMNKIFYQRIKDLDANLRDDFKGFVEKAPRNRNRNRGKPDYKNIKISL